MASSRRKRRERPSVKEADWKLLDEAFEQRELDWSKDEDQEKLLALVRLATDVTVVGVQSMPTSLQCRSYFDAYTSYLVRTNEGLVDIERVRTLREQRRNEKQYALQSYTAILFQHAITNPPLGADPVEQVEHLIDHIDSSDYLESNKLPRLLVVPCDEEPREQSYAIIKFGEREARLTESGTIINIDPNPKAGKKLLRRDTERAIKGQSALMSFLLQLGQTSGPLRWSKASGQAKLRDLTRGAKQDLTVALFYIPTPLQSPDYFLAWTAANDVVRTKEWLAVRAERQAMLRSVDHVVVLSEHHLRTGFPPGADPVEQAGYLLSLLCDPEVKLTLVLVTEEALAQLPPETGQIGFSVVRSSAATVVVYDLQDGPEGDTIVLPDDVARTAQKLAEYESLRDSPSVLHHPDDVVRRLEDIARELGSSPRHGTLVREAAKARVAGLLGRYLSKEQFADLRREVEAAQGGATDKLVERLLRLEQEEFPSAREARGIVRELHRTLEVLNRSICCEKCKKPAELRVAEGKEGVRFEFVHLGEVEPHIAVDRFPHLEDFAPAPKTTLEGVGLSEAAIKRLVSAEDHEECRARFASAREGLSLRQLQPAFTAYQRAIDGVSHEGHPGWGLGRKRELRTDLNAAARACGAVLGHHGASGLLTVAGGGSGSFQIRKPGGHKVLVTLGQELPMFRLEAMLPQDR